MHVLRSNICKPCTDLLRSIICKLNGWTTSQFDPLEKSYLVRNRDDQGRCVTLKFD